MTLILVAATLIGALPGVPIARAVYLRHKAREEQARRELVQRLDPDFPRDADFDV